MFTKALSQISKKRFLIRIFILSIYMLQTPSLWSQLEVKWYATNDRSEQSYARPSIKLDNQENIIYVGSNRVVKYNSLGDVLWFREFLGEAYYGSDDLPFDHLAIDEDNNIYILHNYWNSVFGDSSRRRVFVTKYSSSGHELWSIEFTPANGDYVNNRGASISVDTDKVFVSGSLADDVGPKDGFILCLSALTGVEEWRKTASEDMLNCIVWSRLVVDPVGDIYLGGWIGNSKYCILKCTRNGETMWSVIHDNQTNGHNRLMDMVVSNINGVVVAGHGFTTVNVDDAGDVLWAAMPVSNEPDNITIDRAREILALDDGSVIVTGFHVESHISSSDYDVDPFTIKVNANGNIDWSYGFRANEDENYRQSSNSVAQDIDGDIIIGGTDGGPFSFKFFLNKYSKDGGELIWSFVDESTESPWSEITSLQISSNSEIYVAGIYSGNNERKFMVKKYNSLLTSTDLLDDLTLDFKVYPNPSQDGFFNIYTTDVLDYNVTLTSLGGEKILSGRFFSNENNFDLGSLPSGCYIITISTSESSVSKRIIID